MTQKYTIVYFDENQNQHNIADISFLDETKLKIQYYPNAIVEFPSFKRGNQIGNVETLWFRIPANIRKKEQDRYKAFNKFVELLTK